MFAGNSRHALTDPTQGKGPFESHLSGNFVMKELRFPWLHWHSFAANILPSVLPEDPPLVGHPWVTGDKPDGAEICELAVAIPGIRRWTAGPVRPAPGRTAASSTTRPDPAPGARDAERQHRDRARGRAGRSPPGVDVVLPTSFFVDSEGLAEILRPARRRRRSRSPSRSTGRT